MQNKGEFHSYFMIRKNVLFIVSIALIYVSVIKSRQYLLQNPERIKFRNDKACNSISFSLHQIMVHSHNSRLFYALNYLHACYVLLYYFVYILRWLFICWRAFLCCFLLFFYFWIVHSIELCNYIYNRFHRIQMKVKLVWLLSKL